MTSIADNKLLMHQIGEVFDISASGEDRDGNYIENDKLRLCYLSDKAYSIKEGLNIYGEWN